MIYTSHIDSSVYYLPWGTWNIKKLVEFGCGRDEIKRFCQMAELGERKVQEKCVELGKGVPGSVFLVDMEAFSLTNVMSKAGESYYSTHA